MQLVCTSVVLDIVRGEAAPLATTLRNFCTAELPLMEASLHAMGEDPTPVLPSMQRWVQLQMDANFRGVSTRHTSRPPHQLLHHASRGIHQPTQTRVHQAVVVAQPNQVPSKRGLGQRVANPSPIEQFTQAFTTVGHSLSS